MWQALNIKRIRITHCLGLSGKSSELRSRLVLEQEGNRSLAEKGTTESAEREMGKGTRSVFAKGVFHGEKESGT